MMVILSILKSLKHEKERETKIVPRMPDKQNIKPNFPQQIPFRTVFMEIVKTSNFGELLHENCRTMLFKTCINFGHCFGKQGWVEAVEIQICALKITSMKLSESFSSVPQGALEMFHEVYLGGGGGAQCVPIPPPPFGWDRPGVKHKENETVLCRNSEFHADSAISSDSKKIFHSNSKKIIFAVWRWGLLASRHGIQISMEAILACHSARSTEWLDCHPKSCELWRIRTGPWHTLH